ncbi:YciI family protein [Devosia sp. 66-22]|uniref:YciI family protein n=1 Tax=Devosia sp. 66-22 TaxID=1895753 RepID=UPI000AF6F07F|nr:YciI family protein [Devosia sp. 66-22]
MKTYMLLLYANEAGGEALTPEDTAMWMRKMGEYSDALGKADAFVSTAGLGRSRDARTIHANKDELQVHAGPYADTQEQLGGYYLIRAADMDAAQAWAARCPAALWGHIEIREVQH